MHYRKLTTAALAACVFLMPGSNCQALAPQPTTAQYVPRATDHIYRHAGLRLRIPQNYTALLLTKTGSGQQLFSVTEKASLTAAQKEGLTDSGAGWLFAIGKVSAPELQAMLCADMSGRRLFAQDEAGQYYIFYHPTDVRYMRETPASMQQDQEIWSQLCTWAWNDVPQQFIEDNKLIALTADNSAVGIYLAQLLYKPGTTYTLTPQGKKSLAGNKQQAASFINMLLYGNSFVMVPEMNKIRQGCITLTLPEQQVCLDFFQSAGDTYVLERRPGAASNLYKAIPVEEHAAALTVMQDWYTCLTAAPSSASVP